MHRILEKQMKNGQYHGTNDYTGVSRDYDRGGGKSMIITFSWFY